MKPAPPIPMIKIYSKHGKDFLPTKGTPHSAGIDLRTPEDIVLPPGCEMVINTGIVIDASNYEGDLFYMLVPRSSAGVKHNLRIKNTVGVIDKDYCGPNDFIYVTLQRPQLCLPLRDIVEVEDERLVQLISQSDEEALPVSFKNRYFIHQEGGKSYQFGMGANRDQSQLLYKAGERFAQLVFLPHLGSLPYEVVDKIEGEDRGGLGSTGVV